ncbi:MAG: HlyD family efflux transporter periplasmic adaptor subunit [Dolichospermum sp. DEX182a]|jgi:HlyD family secretion protein|nr:HlyD family efflux transporter periplasmic adaptor subunit [Dolichospermum sp. DEX182a]
MKPNFRWSIALATFLSLSTISCIVYIYLNFKSTQNKAQSTQIEALRPTISDSVVAIGRIEPENRVIKVTGPSNIFNVRVEKLLVKAGDQIQTGQIIAILDNFSQRKAALEYAKKNVKLAQARLIQSKKGEAKQADIAAQQAEISNLKIKFQGEVSAQNLTCSRLKAELEGQINIQESIINRLTAEWQNAKAECGRYETLYQSGAVTTSNRDTKCLQAKTAEEQLNQVEADKTRTVATLSEQIKEAEVNLNETLSSFTKQIEQAEANLQKLQEVRPEDVQVAQAELEKAKTAVEEAQTDLNLTYVRSPFQGQVLKIHTFPGERIGDDGIIDLANNNKIYVVAEIYESDINKIAVGQKATIFSRALTEKFQGTLETIGLQIGTRKELNNDPTLGMDARVLEVKIFLDPEYRSRAKNLINLQVDVNINTNINEKK